MKNYSTDIANKQELDAVKEAIAKQEKRWKLLLSAVVVGFVANFAIIAYFATC